ncbi:unnamed protein product [Ceutorhynchus assimilis]|uniref:Uncharacterized protein n=1 Tax=Ceutorhynchus assimilis TaxID=467358 RepID=A0A9N9QQ78_9CUCU|nr:unnamed protein product [Ceutorhynchus assimilis]
MPRRKRNHRRHGKNKKKRQIANRKNQASSKPNDTTNTDSSMATLLSSDDPSTSCTLVNSDFITPKAKRFRKDSFEMETPVRKLQKEEKNDDLQNQTMDLSRNSDTLINYTPLRGTPVNKRRSQNRHKDGTLNVTNLNVLFDSNEATPIRKTSSLDKSNGDHLRSHISISNLQTSSQENKLSLNKSTQTMDEELIKLDITETPKVSQKKQDMNITPQSNYTKNYYNQKINEINVNPYFKDKEIANVKSQWQKENMEELSFFSPQLFEMKTSSTPIQVVNYLKENDTKLSLINKKLDGSPLNRDIISKTPRSAKLLEQVLNNSLDLTIIDSVPIRLDNVNLNTPPLTEKVINKDKSNSIRLLGSSKKKKRISPKINRLVNYSRVKKISRSATSEIQQLSLENSCEVRTPTARLGVYEKIVNRIKRYSKASVKWSGRMMESCAHLGIQIKNSLSSLCDMYNEKSMLESSQTQKSCHCDSFKQEIGDLYVKIDHLTEEVGQLRRQIDENHNASASSGDHNNYLILNEDLNKVKQELITFKDLRSELTTLKEQFQCFANTAAPVDTIVTKPPAAPPAPALPPPPPPPPPPPLPPMPLIQTVPPKLNLQKKSKSAIGMVVTDNSRPVISLDDILKVKLKKASERPVSTPNCRQRTISTPMGSTGDLFRQIKLRSGKPNFLRTPAINQSSVSTPGVSNSTFKADLTTSPANSLNKFLESTSVWRVKRLKKVGAYSFDNSVHRRSPMVALSPASRRERP